MNAETAIEIFVSSAILIAGLLTLAFRNRPNSLVGVRFGYTYLSERAWRKANTFAGVFFVSFSGILFLMTYLTVPVDSFVVVLLAGVILGVWLSERVAKREYELDDLSREAPEKPSEVILKPNLRPYLVAQLLLLALYLALVAFYWDALPDQMAVHFDASGTPNGFASKLWGAIIIPLMVWSLFFAMTLMAREPGFFGRMGKVPPGGWRVWGEFATLMAAGLLFLSSMTVLYNVGAVTGGWINYSVWVFLALVFVGIYRLLSVGRRG